MVCISSFFCYLATPLIISLVQYDDIRDVTVLQRIQFFEVRVVAVPSQFWKWLCDAQIKRIPFGFGFDDAVPVQLQAHAANQAVGLDSDQADTFFPAEIRKRS